MRAVWLLGLSAAAIAVLLVGCTLRDLQRPYHEPLAKAAASAPAGR
jgi:hypothetical protein